MDLKLSRRSSFSPCVIRADIGAIPILGLAGEGPENPCVRQEAATEGGIGVTGVPSTLDAWTGLIKAI